MKPGPARDKIKIKDMALQVNLIPMPPDSAQNWKPVAVAAYGTAPCANRNSLLACSHESAAGQPSLPAELKTISQASLALDAAEEKRLAKLGFAPLAQHAQKASQAMDQAAQIELFNTPSVVSVHWRTASSKDNGPITFALDQQTPLIRYTVEPNGKSPFDFISSELGTSLILYHEQGHCEHKNPAFDPTPKTLPYGMSRGQANTLAVLGKMGNSQASELLAENYADAFAVAAVKLLESKTNPAESKAALARLADYRDIYGQLEPDDPHKTSFAIRNADKAIKPSDSGIASRQNVCAAALKGTLQALAIPEAPNQDPADAAPGIKERFIAEARPAVVSDVLADWIARKSILAYKPEILSPAERKTAAELPPWDRTVLPDPSYWLRIAQDALQRMPKSGADEAYDAVFNKTKAAIAGFVEQNFEGNLENIDWNAARADAEKSAALSSPKRQLEVASEFDKQMAQPQIAPQSVSASADELSQWRARRNLSFVPKAASPAQKPDSRS